jgi:hypothetical protein
MALLLDQGHPPIESGDISRCQCELNCKSDANLIGGFPLSGRVSSSGFWHSSRNWRWERRRSWLNGYGE